MTFSPTDAAFEGFRVARRHPGVLFIWGGVYLLVVLVIFGVTMLAMGSTLMTLLEHPQAAESDPGAAFASMRGLLVSYAVVIPLSLLVEAVFSAGAYRAVLRPEEKGLAYLKLGGDEARVFIATLSLVLLFLVLYSAGVLVAVLAATTVYGANHVAGVLTGILLGLGAFVFVLWVFVRISMAQVMTFADRRIHVFGSFRLTRGRFWPLLGLYALVLLLYLGVMFGLYMLFLVFGLVGAGGMAAALGQGPSASAVAANGAMILGLVLGLFLIAVCLVVMALLRLVLYAPQAAAYRALTDTSEDAAQAF